MIVKTRRYRVTTERMFDVFFQPNQPLSGFRKVFNLSLVPSVNTVKELWDREDKEYAPIPFDYDESHLRRGAPDEWYWLPHRDDIQRWALVKYPLVSPDYFWVVTKVRAPTYVETLEQRIKDLEAQSSD